MLITNNITVDQLNYIIHSLRQKKISYITPQLAVSDFQNNRLYILIEKQKPVAMCAIVWDETYQYYAIKRLVCFQKRNSGKGYANALIQYCSNLGLYPCGCTPWINNKPMQHLLEKNGFSLQYIFNEKWCFYKKCGTGRII